MNKILNLNKNGFLFFFFYVSLILGFIFDESLNQGAYLDWNTNKKLISEFSSNLLKTLISYEDYGNRHSPLYNIILSLFYKIGLSLDFIRLINLHFSLLLIFVLYRCLKIKFKSVDDSTLQLLSFLVFFSPTFRSLAIWPDSRIIGLLFFVCCLYYFLIFFESYKKKYALYSVLALITSSYFSPNFSIFSIFFYFLFYKNLNFRFFLFLILISFILSIPMIYYIFFLDVNFIAAGNTPNITNETTKFDFNIFNKILLISSIFIFHLLPIIIISINKFELLKFIKRYWILIVIFWAICIYFFSYEKIFTGGGAIFQILDILSGSNILFFFVSFFVLVLTSFIIGLNRQNSFVFLLSILSNPQNTVYHKYYEPFFLIMFLILFKGLNFKFFFSNKKNILILYLYSIFFIILRLVKIYFF